ncbi:PREDICTED: uncharacterized protein LOC107064225 [Polistes dominula]|uniref:Uncharacterized protein LOC107064225 n=1 Tax=Polistes dominula TaxID=743375 RepID=A0ABM1HVZ9_POLDO|nr:PREDICTED: uncharacterized protein LOC107064225 [Polistes dominula]
MSSKAELLFLERLQHKALECLDTFPSKVVELNEIIEEFMPESARNNSNNANITHPKARSASTLSSTQNFTTYYSLFMCDRNRTKHGIYKRRYRRIYGGNNTNVRRYRGAFGQLLVFVISRLASCAKQILFTPSCFIIDNVIPMFFTKSGFKSVQCGPSSNWNSSVLGYTTNNENYNTIVGNLISIMRPSAVQLITDITIIKRWLQALGLIKTSLESIELTNATRTTETIDCWSYELYFHLKNLQVKMLQEKANEKESKDCNDMTHLNLWHRMVQLRNNYIILYETLNNNEKILNLSSMEVT